jgi:hypothetical protein
MRALGLAFVVFLAAGCGTKGSTFGVDGGGDNDGDPLCDPNDPFCDPSVMETGDNEGAPPCIGLQCQQVQCGGGVTTTVSGTVFAPNGTLPLYNVIVYVPNAALDPIKNGAICDKCGAMVSGSPVVTALTNSKGQFTLKDVPVGSNIPIVIQVGKWRKKFILPNVAQCVNTPVANGVLKFPAKIAANTDDAMPKIAMVTGGCDPLACILAKIGIDSTEFVDTSNTTKHVTWYNGQSGSAPGSPQPATALWGSLTEMKKFDMVINSCECSEYNNTKTSPQLLQQYADQGGRVFGSHYHYTWTRNLIPAWQGTATWSAGSGTLPDIVNMTFPKGKALAEWLMTVQASTQLGVIPLQVKTPNVSTVNMPTTQWISSSGGAGATTHYVSFNTPVGLMPDKQCGKVVYAGLHVSSSAGTVNTSFPAGCNMTLSPDEKALVFLLFDLSSCIQDELKDPEPPPVPK